MSGGRQLQTLDARIRALDATLLKVIVADRALQHRDEVLQSILGLGPVNAANLPAAMPELGGLDRRAPRERVYMAAVAALRRHSPLHARGKEAKVTLVAVMRKLIVLADALLCADRLWQAAPPTRLTTHLLSAPTCPINPEYHT